MTVLPDTAVIPGVCDWCGDPLTGNKRVACGAGHRNYRRNWLLRIPRGPGLPALDPPHGSPLLTIPDPRVPSKPSGLQVSFWKAVDVLAGELLRRKLVNPCTEKSARIVAETFMRDALPEKQRQRLEAMNR